MDTIQIPICEDPEKSCDVLIKLLNREFRNKEECEKTTLKFNQRDVIEQRIELLTQDFLSKVRLIHSNKRDYFIAKALLELNSTKYQEPFMNLLNDQNENKPTIDVAIITIIEPELKAAKIAFDIPLEKDCNLYKDGYRFWEFTFSDSKGRVIKAVMTKVGEPGPVPCANACNKLFGIYRVNLCVLIGIAGGVKKKVHLGDTISANLVLNYESQKLKPDGPKKRTEPFSIDKQLFRDVGYFDPKKFDWQKEIHEKINNHNLLIGGEKRLKNFNPQFKIGVILSGQKLFADGGLPQFGEEYHDQTLAVDMESSGFADACIEASINWLVFRGISDFGDINKPKSDKFQVTFALPAALALKMFLSNEYHK